jgi:hypothetical protein
MNTLTEKRLKELEELSKSYWPSDYLVDEDIAALIQAARERNKLRELLCEVYEDGLKTNMKEWNERVESILGTPKELHPPTSGNSTSAP